MILYDTTMHVLGEVNTSALDEFCSDIPASHVCMDNTNFANIYARNKTTYDKQSKQCDGVKAYQSCHNDPSACTPITLPQKTTLTYSTSPRKTRVFSVSCESCVSISLY